MSIFDLEADHEARGIAEIVSEGRPQAVRTANRIARANNGGANCNPGHASRAARIRRAEKRTGHRKALDRITTNGTTGCRRERPGEGKGTERASALTITGNRDTATGLDTAGDQLARRAVALALPQGNEKPTTSALPRPCGMRQSCGHVFAERGSLRLCFS